ncbi:MAG TPA: LuxR C-terminal-related transcriptional regulator [Chloroflexota bacterium]|nr:LuxR C-terminal-related transcriptional regulator [Chloroflexota bacterium]
MAGPICYVCGEAATLEERVAVPGHDPAICVHERCLTRLAADALHLYHRDVPPKEVIPARSVGLSPREAQVLRLMAGGHTNKAMADALSLSDKRVRNIVSDILTKLDAASRTEAVAIAARLGLLD